MSIDRATAARVAKLARIKVDESSLDILADEFNQILGFIEQLNDCLLYTSPSPRDS